MPASVVASFYPLAFAAAEVGGPGVDVRNLTPPGAEPHDLEATPGDVAGAPRSRISCFCSATASSRSSRTPRGKASTSSASSIRPASDCLEDGDVHLWLDPLRYATLVEAGRRSALGKPAASARLARRLEALDREYRDGLADCARREIVTSHAAFGYLAERYGLEQIAITGQQPRGRACAA